MGHFPYIFNQIKHFFFLIMKTTIFMCKNIIKISHFKVKI